MQQKKFKRGRVLLLLLFIVAPFSIKMEGQKPNFSGWVRGSVYGSDGEYRYTNLFSEAAIRGSYREGGVILFADIRAKTGSLFNDPYTTLEIKEAYGGYSSNRVSLLVGNQIINRGKTEIFGAMPQITPLSPFFLTADPDDQKLSNFMVNFELALSNRVRAYLIGIPMYRESHYRFDLFDIGENITFTPFESPVKGFKNGTIAAGLDFQLPGVDLALSYFRGYDPNYGFKLNSLTPISPTEVVLENSPLPYLTNSIGLSGEGALGSFLLSGELAYNHTEEYGEKYYIPNPSLDGVFGLEYNRGGATLLAEYFVKKVFDYEAIFEPPLPSSPEEMATYPLLMANYQFANLNRELFGEVKEVNHSVGLSYQQRLLYDQLTFDLSLIANITSEQWMVRSSLEWSIRDNLSATIGGNYITGPEGTIFHYTKGIINGLFAQVKVSF